MILTLTSDTYSQGELHAFQPRRAGPAISQIDVFGDVDVTAAAATVRVGLNPQARYLIRRVADDGRTAIQQCQRA